MPLEAIIKSPFISCLWLISVLDRLQILLTKIIFFGRLLAQNLSYIPFPKPTRPNLQSAPKIGTIAMSIFLHEKCESLGSKILNLFASKGSRNGTILKILFAFLPFFKTNGENILIFFCFFKNKISGKIFTSIFKGT